MFLRSLLRIGILTILSIQLSVALPAQAQVQASCTFHLFKLPTSPGLFPRGVNDWGTIVGDADFGGGPPHKFEAFIRFSGGGVSYFLPAGALSSVFFARNNLGVAVGSYTDASKHGHSFILQGSTLIPVVDPKAIPNSTLVFGINRWNSTVGFYIDSAVNGIQHGFKRFSNGNFLDLDYPGAQATSPAGINDRGVVVGSYSNDPSGPVVHGFIYHNGSWATLDVPNSIVSGIVGISNAGVMVAATDHGSFLYENGKFKLIKVPNSVFTNVTGISPDGLIVGTTATSGFLAACH